MKRISTRVWIIIIFLLVFSILTVAVTVILRDFVRDQLVIPLLNTFNFIRRFFKAIDSDLIWGVFILALYAWMLLSLPSLTRPSSQSNVYTDRRSRSGRLRHWLNEIYQLRSERHLTRYATLELKKLILNTVAFRQQCSLRQAEQWLDAPENQRLIPPEVRFFLHAEPLSQVQLQSFWQTLKRWLLRYPSMPQSATNIDIEPVLRFLEAQETYEYKPDYPINP